jgi:hypothetical protein
MALQNGEHFSIVLNVDEDCRGIAYGAYLTETGEIRVENARIVIVDGAVPVIN